MKSISTKLFLALLSLTALVLVATLLLARWSFDYGFLDYLNNKQQQRINNMAEDIAVHYADNAGQWTDSFRRSYRRIYFKWFPGPSERPPRPNPNRPRPDRHVNAPEELNHQVEDQAEGSHKEIRNQRVEDGRPLPLGPGGGFRRRGGLRGLNEPIAVFDSQGNVLAGNHEQVLGKEVLIAPIIYLDKVVGEVRVMKQVKLNSGVESSFSIQQNKASLFIAILSFILAGIASWLLARMLLAPIYKTNNTIGSLVKGEYSTRLTVTRDDELGQLMLDVNRLSETLQQNQLSRKRWLADISHELRTPVTVLSGEIEAVLDGIRPLDQDSIESFNHEVTRLKRLIDDLYQLSLSDIGGLRYEFRSTNLKELFEMIIGQYQFQLKQANLELLTDFADNVNVDADPSRLEQLFTNLLNNSLAYTDAPGKLKISLSRKDDMAIIRFNDSAPSVQESKFEEIFEPLYREDSSRQRSKSGGGLGLTISQNIVKAHQGDIEVKRSSLGGLEFVIRLPIKRLS